MSIRRAAARDAGALLALWAQLVPRHGAMEHVRSERREGPPGALHRRILAAAWADPDHQALFVAAAGGDTEAVGFVRASVVAEGPCPGRIDTLVVAPAHRGRGVGRALVQHALAWLSTHDAHEVSVDIVEGNDAATAFYQHMGFVPLFATLLHRPADAAACTVAASAAAEPDDDGAPLHDAVAMADAEAEHWVEAIGRRVASADPARLPAEMLHLSRLRRGGRAVEVGCGSGTLLIDLARRVGSEGRVVGLEPHPLFAREARRRAEALGLAPATEVRTTALEASDLPAAWADAALAHTAMVHLRPAALAAVLSEMVRVIRPGGRAVAADEDGDTWVIDHPDRSRTRRIIRFHADARYADGWTGRRLFRLLGEAGLRDVEVHPLVHTDTLPDSHLFGVAERVARAAAAAGVVAEGEAESWLEDLRAAAARGRFFSSINFYVCAGTRP